MHALMNPRRPEIFSQTGLSISIPFFPEGKKAALVFRSASSPVFILGRFSIEFPLSGSWKGGTF